MDHADLEARWAPTLGQITRQQRHTQDDEFIFQTIPAAVRQEADADTDQKNADLAFTGKNETWEESVDVASDPHFTGVMVAFYPSPAQAQELAVAGGEAVEQLHLTLAFMGEVGAELVPADEERLISAVRSWAATQGPLSAKTNGLGLFHNDPPVTYASIDSPALPAARQSLVEALDKAGLPPVATHGFTPHMTLAYDELRDHVVPAISMTFSTVVVKFADTRTEIPLAASPQKAAQLYVGPGHYDPSWGSLQYTAGQMYVGTGTTWTPMTMPVTSSSLTMPIVATDRPLAPEVPVPATTLAPVDTPTAFVTTVNGKTMITGPAATIAAMKEPTVEDITDAHMLWMHGRFVGAETPNRNGALWSAGDLELAQATVTNGPLNWLHEARHVIGTLAKADYVDPRKNLSLVQSAATSSAPVEPHITATAAIWRWIYPDEAYVIEQASDQEMLWYSMECISKQVACAGPEGCGNTTSYAQYMAGAACEHIRQRASIRQFKNPIFLGGAVIVPPTRPGWAEADARVMSGATALAEAAFEQAGRPDVSASDWEQMMAQVVKFTQS